MAILRSRLVRVGACLEFTGCKGHGGYGLLTVQKADKKISLLTHRIALTEKLGREIGEGLLALHTCNNPPCCEETHLYEGTPQQNMDDMKRAGRGKYKPPMLGKRGEAHNRTKFSDAIVAEVLASTEPVGAIAEKYGASSAWVSQVRAGKTRKVT